MKGLLNTLAGLFRPKPPPAIEGPPVEPALALYKDAPSFSAHDRDIVIRTLWGEARGEPFSGQVAVVHVIRNRAMRKGTSMAYECLRPLQFSCWNKNDPNEKLIRAMSPESWEYISMGNAVEYAMQRPDITGGALHYHAKSIKPAWAKPPGEVSLQLGGHIFWKGVPW